MRRGCKIACAMSLDHLPPSLCRPTANNQWIRAALHADPGLAFQANVGTGFTALHWAAAEGKAECAWELLEAGAGVEEVDCDGKTALIWGARWELVLKN